MLTKFSDAWPTLIQMLPLGVVQLQAGHLDPASTQEAARMRDFPDGKISQLNQMRII